LELKKNRVKQLLQDGGTCFGTMLRMVNAPEVIPLCAMCGWDYVILDTEHYAFNRETLSRLSVVCRYEPLTLLVRVPDKHYHQMASTLDLGVEGLILPRVESQQETESILQSTRYFPLGSKGASVSTTATAFQSYSYPDYMNWHNQNLLIVVQIESQEGVDRVDEIVSPEGVDAVMIGPADLSQSLGIPGEFSHPRMEATCQKIIDVCRRHGVAPGIHFADPNLVRKWVARGMRFVTYQYDSMFLQTAFEGALRDLRTTMETDSD
jgi:2-keto-3-deoxy-L-rhamnonate aldolase RhmA